MGNFLSSLEEVSFSRKTAQHGLSMFVVHCNIQRFWRAVCRVGKDCTVIFFFGAIGHSLRVCEDNVCFYLAQLSIYLYSTINHGFSFISSHIHVGAL